MPRVPSLCQHCTARRGTLRCTHCAAARYCSHACATAAWAGGADGHRAYCAAPAGVSAQQGAAAAGVSAQQGAAAAAATGTPVARALVLVRQLRALWIGANGDSGDMDDDDDDDGADGGGGSEAEEAGGGDVEMAEAEGARKRGREGEAEPEPAAKRARRAERQFVRWLLAPGLDNDVVVAEIFRRLTPEELQRVRAVNRAWYVAAARAITTVDAALSRHLTDALLADMPNVTSLDVSQHTSAITGAGLAALGRLRTLVLGRNRHITAFQLLLPLTALTALDISRSGGANPRTLATLSALSALSSLRELALNRVPADDRWPGAIGGLLQLTRVDALEAEVYNGGFHRLTNLRSLGLGLRQTPPLLAALTQLTRLHLLIYGAFPWWPGVQPIDVVRLAPQLRTLVLSLDASATRTFDFTHQAWLRPTQQPGEGPAALAAHPALERVEIRMPYAARVDGVGNAHPAYVQRVPVAVADLLVGLRSLRELAVAHWRVGAASGADVSLQHNMSHALTQLTQLTRLELDHVPMARAQFVRLGARVPLRALHVNGPLVLDGRLRREDLAPFTALERLVLGPRPPGALAYLTNAQLRAHLPSLRGVARL